MRRRSGALHCQTQQQLLELAQKHQIGLYYNDGPLFKELKMHHPWNISDAQKQTCFTLLQYELNTQDQELQDQKLQLLRGLRYLQNCVVDNQTIRCSIDLCIIANKLQETLTKILTKDSLLQLFIQTGEIAQNCIQKPVIIHSFPNSNVFSLETLNVESAKHSHHSNKENSKMSPKSWLRSVKMSQKMMELLIIKKQTSIRDNQESGPREFNIIYRLFIVNQKYLQNPLIKIYLRKSHFVVDTRGGTLQSQTQVNNMSGQQNLKINIPVRARKTSLYNKLFNSRSFFDNDCVIYNRGQFLSGKQIKSQRCQFRLSFHKIEDQITKDYMRKINDILAQENRKSCAWVKDSKK